MSTRPEFPPFSIYFYDAFDGWMCVSEVLAGISTEEVPFPKTGTYQTLREAIGACDSLMVNLERGNRQMGEHYSVFDATGTEVHRGY